MQLLLHTWIKYHLVNYRYIFILFSFISPRRYITWKYFVWIVSCVVFNASCSQRIVAPAFLVKAMSSPPRSTKLSEKTVRLPTWQLQLHYLSLCSTVSKTWSLGLHSLLGKSQPSSGGEENLAGIMWLHPKLWCHISVTLFSKGCTFLTSPS